MKRIKKNHVIISALAILIAVAGYINYTGDIDNIISVKSKETNSTAVNADDNSNNIADNNDIYVDEFGEENSNDVEVTEEPGTTILTSGNAVSGINSDIISQAKLNREQVRAKNKEMLMEIVNNSSVSENEKNIAMQAVTEIAKNSEKEAAIEILLEAKGFNNVVVSLSDSNCDIVVGLKELDEKSKAQIEDIVKRKTGFSADKITINVCNN